MDCSNLRDQSAIMSRRQGITPQTASKESTVRGDPNDATRKKRLPCTKCDFIGHPTAPTYSLEAHQISLLRSPDCGYTATTKSRVGVFDFCPVYYSGGIVSPSPRQDSRGILWLGMFHFLLNKGRYKYLGNM